MKKIISAVLAAVTLLSVASCNTTPQDTTADQSETETIGKDTEAMTDTETTDLITDEEPVFYEKAERDPFDPQNADLSSADWNNTITTANAHANGVQGKFTDAARNKFLIWNENCSVLYNLTEYGNKKPAAIYSADGKAYFENTSDAYIVDKDGKTFSAAYSPTNGRMNSNRLGFYYYDFRFRDQVFANPDADGGAEEYDILKKTGKWTGNDVKNIDKKKNYLKYEVTSSIDPFLYSSVNFETENYNALQITIKTEYDTVGYIYIMAGSHTSFNQDQMTNFKCTAGQTTTVYVPLAHLPDYTKNVTAVRIDCGNQSGEHIEITEFKAVSRANDMLPLAFERIYHTYSDKMHESLRAIATEEYSAGSRFETKTVIPADTVRKMVIKNANGEVSSLDGFDFSTAEYVGFDIKNVGIFGIIMPVVENNGYIKVELTDGNYVITRGIDIDRTFKKGDEILFGHRLYTSTTHQFNDFRKEAYIERNPLTDIYVKDIDDAKFEGYDGLIGCYIMTVQAMEFSVAMYYKPDKQFNVNATIRGDGVVDRTIYVQTAENLRNRRGRLECAAILDESNRLLPIPLEVGKNFDGENEEPIYYPEKATGAAAYGEVYVPITVGKDECKQFTMLHLYQNWGNYPLKQLSFIAFHIPYYHLSVGVTETNCIVPYYVYGKDGFVLPDFRANSAPLWDNGHGTQHTSIGKHIFLQYTDADGNSYMTDSQSADIASHGPVYADVTTNYLSDDGKISVSYRHTEMAQTDENRTYYHIKLEVLDDVSFKEFRKDFSFYTFSSYSVTFSKIGYLDENNEKITEKVEQTERIIKLGKEYPYFDYFRGDVRESVNSALIIRRSDITIGGEKFDGNFVLRDKFDGKLNYGALSLDLGEVTLKKGDVMELDIILLPWGYSTSITDKNVRNVREDSCIDPYKITVIEGEPYDDFTIPSVRAKDNKAVFKISGGASTAAVKIYGFKDYTLPTITFKADGKDADIKLAGVNGYDGYQVNLDADGTYSFSFNVDMNKAEEYEITVIQ